MKTNIKLRVTPEQSAAVQKICFANNIQPWGLTDKVVRNLDQAFISISKNKILGKYNYALGGNKFYFWDKDEKEEVDADLFIRTNGTCEESIDAVKDLLDYQSKEDMFKQYGFEVPDFDCTILAKVEDKYIGFVTTNQGEVYPTYWFANGCRHIDEGNQWNLIPAKQPWYEICKFPILVWDEDNDLFAIRTRGEYTSSYLELCKPLSNEEIDQLKQDF